MDSFERAAQAICKLNLWEESSVAVWGIVSQLAAEPILCLSAPEQADSPLAGKLCFFPGFAALRDYQLFRKIRDYGFVSSPLDLVHDELEAHKDGTWAYRSFEAGYLPWAPNPSEHAFLGTVLNECCGVMMRLEEDGEFVIRYAQEHPNNMFARFEGLDGKWRDGALKLPDEKQITMCESVSLSKTLCAKASALPFAEKTAWEVDFMPFTALRTTEPRPRYPYLFMAVDRTSGKRMVWMRFSVDGKPNCLKRMWESLAGHLLAAVCTFGAVPGEIHLRSGRLMRFLRPLGLQLPFKIVLNAKLAALDAVIAKSLKEGNA